MNAAKKKTTAKTTAKKKDATKAKPAQKSPGPARKKATAAPTRKKTAETKRKAVKKKVAPGTPEKIPALLLEGDQSPAPVPSGPGSRYDLGRPTSGPERAASGAEQGELPEAYGTKRIIATARDPHWLYVFWDLTDAQQREYNKRSRDGHLILRLFAKSGESRLLSETHVHPESRNWFVNVPAAGADYSVVLGYQTKTGSWTSVSESRPVTTPPDSVAADATAEFATLPSELPLRQLVELVRSVVAANVPLMEALEQLRAEGFDRLPGPEHFKQSLRQTGETSPAPSWTPDQERALAQVITMDEVRRVWLGSHEITELIRKQLVHELASQAAAAVGGARAVSSLGVSSPMGGEIPGPKGFWFNVNAELIIYGATEPDATVTIGDRQIRLRGDGSFSYRFALPDGQYELPIQATSADGDDSRNADLSFSRDTQIRGEVGTHPQDQALRPPRPEHTA